MTNPPPRRKPNRAPGFDYREPGPYVVTICEHRRSHRFGAVIDQQMRPNAAGDMVGAALTSLVSKCPSARVEAHDLMPNHLHMLVLLDARDVAGNVSGSDVIGWFKTMTTNWYMRGVREERWPPFDGHLWQRSFHDHIVRNDADMDWIRTYIANNPALWTKDTFYNP